jgi:hypothetical protein
LDSGDDGRAGHASRLNDGLVLHFLRYRAGPNQQARSKGGA